MTVQMLTLIAIWCGTMSGVGASENLKVRACRNRIIDCQGPTGKTATAGIEPATTACFTAETKTTATLAKKK